MVAEVRAVSEVDDALRQELLTCWTDVTNAGGAVGFVPPVTEDDVAPVLDQLLDGVRSGRDVLALLTVDGATAGFASVVAFARARCGGTGRRCCGVQVHPSRQGRGAGPGADGRRARHRARPAAGSSCTSPLAAAPGSTTSTGDWATPRSAGCPVRSGWPPATTATRSSGLPALIRRTGAGRVVAMADLARAPGSRDTRRERLVGLLVLGVAARPAGVLGDLVRHRAGGRGHRPAASSASSSPPSAASCTAAPPAAEPSRRPARSPGRRPPARRTASRMRTSAGFCAGRGPAPAPSTSGTVPISVPPES